MLVRLLGLLVCLAIAASPAPGAIDRGLSAFEDGNYKDAIKAWLPLAVAGDARAQFRMGKLYEQGLGIDKDLGIAADWFRRAAEQDFPRAAVRLGNLYRTGEGVDRDDAAAVEWYRKAALLGDPWARSSLGFMYEKGLGVARDDVQAVQLYIQAAEQDFPWAELMIGLRYHDGIGIPKDPMKAYRWINRAAALVGERSAGGPRHCTRGDDGGTDCRSRGDGHDLATARRRRVRARGGCARRSYGRRTWP